eukprot:EG_transcript_11468
MNVGTEPPIHPTHYGSSAAASSAALSSNPTVYMAEGLPQEYRDVWYAAAFGLQLLLTVVTAALAVWLSGPDQPMAPEPNYWLVVTWLILVGVTACCLAVFLVAVLQQGPPAVLVVGLMEVAVSLLLVLAGRGPPPLCSAGVALGLALATTLWLLAVRRHLPFASAVLQTAANCLTQFPGSLGVAAGVLVTTTAYVAVWGLSVSLWARLSPAWGVAWLLVCLLMLQWTAEVLRNVVHLAVSGAVAEWYFTAAHLPPSLPPSPPLYSARRPLAVAFGSVCCGSLLPAVVIPVHSMLLSLQSAVESMKNGSVPALLLYRMLHGLNPVMQCYNLYAFAHVALYGKPYFQAARDTWTLTMTSGLIRVFNDSLVGTVPVLFSLLAGAILGGLVELITRSTFIFLLSTVEGVVVAAVVFTTCTSAATTLCVCFAERPGPLQAIDVALYCQINEAALEAAAAGLVPRAAP